VSDTTLKIMGRLADNFTVVSNEFARSPEVTPRAARLYLYLASHQTGWKLSIAAAMNATGMGRGTVFAALKDLRELGYVKRYQVVDESDRFAGTEYQVFSVPVPVSKRDDVAARTDPRIPKNGTRDEQGKHDVDTGQSRVTDFGIRENGIPKNDTLKKTNSKKTNLEENQREEGAQAALASTPARSKRGMELPEGWMPDRAVIDAMRQECPTVDLEAEHRKFVDYWLAVPGAKGRKKDWNATWRNWVRRAAETAPAGRESFMDVGERLMEQVRREAGDSWKELE